MNGAVAFTPHWEDVCSPRMGLAHLTELAFMGKDLRPLWHEMMDRVTDDIAGSGIGMDLSVISQLLGDKATGLALQGESLALRRLYRSPCAKSPPRLRVLAFAAVMDIGGNTPLEFLLQGSEIELATFYVVPGMPLAVPMPDHDVAIIVAPDGDAAQASMTEIAALVASWPRPVLNMPAGIRILDRDRLYHALKQIAGLAIPQTVRIGREALEDVAQGKALPGAFLTDGKFPLIIRPIGSHAGFGLARIADPDALCEYMVDRMELEFFISPFVDYASSDGMFRKYRIVFVDGKPYPCHMAIADEWKVWYLNADMALSVPHRLEEAVWMESFDQDFAVRHAAALTQMAASIGLDYFAVDCAQARDGALLVFEADNTAIVHDMDPPSVYPYKSPQMQKIFGAVQTMCFRRAGRMADAA
jgi:glutathione synthase/RimK-type ligase-like ATP-grasp enzyme